MYSKLTVNPTVLRELYFDLRKVEIQDGDTGFSDSEIEAAAELLTTREIVEKLPNTKRVQYRTINGVKRPRSKDSYQNQTLPAAYDDLVQKAIAKIKGMNPNEATALPRASEEFEKTNTLISAKAYISAKSLANILVDLEEIINRPGIYDMTCNDVPESCDAYNEKIVAIPCDGPLEIDVTESAKKITISAKTMVLSKEECAPDGLSASGITLY